MLNSMIEAMKKQGITFEIGLNDEEIKRIEKIYEITFPDSLRSFYKSALPAGEYFPKWKDFSDDNIKALKKRIDLPYKLISMDIEELYPLFNTKNTPKLIPIYSHRYMPMIDHPDPPVFSTVGMDTIWYGKDLCNYLENEFLHGYEINTEYIPYIPLWSEIIKINNTGASI